jgi:hypothetical protein
LAKPFNLSQLRRVRWFLLDGWGPQAPRRTGDAVMGAREATLLLPCLTPRDLSVVMGLEAPQETRIGLRLNDRPVADLLIGPGASEWTVGLPASVLFRGDNALALRAESETPLVHLRRFTIRSR